MNGILKFGVVFAVMFVTAGILHYLAGVSVLPSVAVGIAAGSIATVSEKGDK